MKVGNLKVGQAYKYKELCDVLGVKPTDKANNQRNAQFKKLGRYCKYHKEGHKIIIDELYPKELEKVDKRTQGNNNNISKNLRYMILDLLSKHKITSDELGFSKYNLYKYCNMVNHNYREARKNRDVWGKIFNANNIAIEECFDYTDDRLSSTFRRACSTLANNNKALGFRYGYNYVLASDTNILDEHITASIEIENIIRETENKVMKQMKISRYDKIYQYGRWNEFKSKVIEILQNEHSFYFSNLVYYYNAIVFNYLNETIERVKKGFEEDFGLDKETAKENVNKYFSKSLDGTIEKRHKTYSESNGFDMDIKNLDLLVCEYRESKIYIEEQKELKDSIIKVNYEQLKFDIDLDKNNKEVPF